MLHIFILFLVLNATVLHAPLLRSDRSHLIVLPTILARKSQVGLFIIRFLFCGTVFLLTYFIFTSHSASFQPNLSSPLFLLSGTVFLKKTLNSLFYFTFPPKPHGLDYLWMDISVNDLVLLLHLTFISLSSLSLTALSCYFNLLGSMWEWVIINLFLTFTGSLY
jgi:hypothetical protein